MRNNLSFDILSLIIADLGEPIKHSGRWFYWHCPFHEGDHSPSFAVTPDNGRWFCFGCGKTGDAITWMIEYQKISKIEAIERVKTSGQAQFSKSISNNLSSCMRKKARPDRYQEIWSGIIEVCANNLWRSEGEQARSYLYRRGLKDLTIQSPFFRLGYSPGFETQGVWIDRGIVIPCFTTTNDLEIEYISYIKIRRLIGKPKYKKLPGGGANLSGLFGAEWAIGSDVLFLTEGEFDAMLLHQEAGNLIGVSTLGGAGDRLDFSRFGKYILSASHIITVYDSDPAGQKGADVWEKLSARVHRVQVPKGKDITDFWQADGDLAGWVMEVLKNLKIS